MSNPHQPAAETLYHLLGCGGSTTEAPASTLGFKAWNLAQMAALGLPVPPAFVLPTHWCSDAQMRQGLHDAGVLKPAIAALEAATGLAFGSTRRPLLLSVRSGAPVSMPGMMQTLLNVGLCDATLPGLVRLTGNPRLAWDAYRRLVAQYGEVVDGLPPTLFEDIAPQGDGGAPPMDFSELRGATQRMLAAYAAAAGRPFPQDPRAQLVAAVEAVFASWQSAKACEYRRLNDVSDAVGTAVTVQAMVFGNAGGRSGAGVGFTRDPATGAPGLWVDFLFNAQGEDVVSGRRSAHGHDELSTVLPEAWQALQAAAATLERTLADMQDFEFTVNEGRLFMLQTRSGKRTPTAAVRIALDMLSEGLIDADTAHERTAAIAEEALALPRVVAAGGGDLSPLARGASASSGVAIGEIAFDEERAKARHAAGSAVVLVRRDAETDDIAALEAAAGLLTERGARTSHAAVVARQLGKVCIVGCTGLRVDLAARTAGFGERVLREGDVLTLDGGDGAVYAGEARVEVHMPQDLLRGLRALRERARAAAASAADEAG